MDPNCNPGPPPRQNPPKDGLGPRGFPDCYYTSRVLNSTFRYARFVSKLRAQETEQRIGAENLHRDLKNKELNEFFARSERRSLINNVAYRVDLCMKAFEEDLQARRRKLLEKLTQEEELNCRKFVTQAQEGPELIWQEKKDRLAFLLAKRQKERDAKSATSLTKPAHLYPCLVKIRTQESKEIQKYQILEKQMRKEAEKELEKMWHEVALKESEALAARMEYDAIERARRDIECNQYNELVLEQIRAKRAREQEVLKEQVLQRKLQAEANEKRKAEEDRQREEMRVKENEEKNEMLKERELAVAKKEADIKLVDDTWDQLTAQKIKEGNEQEELRRQKQRDLDVCNRRMVVLKNHIAKVKNDNEHLILEEGSRRRDVDDLRRCQYRKWTQRNKVEIAAANQKAVLERKAEELTKDDDRNEYDAQVSKQLEELVKHKQMTDAQARKLHRNDLTEQIAYNKLLKERARQEELEQMKKYEIAKREYHDEIQEMLARKYYSNEVHPFLKKMDAGLEIRKCPCTLPNYCADPVPKCEQKK